MLRPCIVKISVLGYFPLYIYIFKHDVLIHNTAYILCTLTPITLHF